MAKQPGSALAYRRTFHIIRALQQQPLNRAELERHVAALEGSDAYSDGTASAFERDLKRAREQFGIDIRYDHSARCYRIAGVEEAGWLELTDETLDALVYVYHTFGDDAPGSDRVRRALDEVTQWLSLARRQKILARSHGVAVELRGLDQSLSPLVLERVRDALSRRVVLRLFHASPRNPAERPVKYEVEPIELRHSDGHWYLRCFVRWYDAGAGRHVLEQERRFRMSYIVPEGLELTSEKLPLTPRTRRPMHLRYLLHPDIARGDVSHRFDNTVVTMRDDGWAEVTATAHDEFYVAQTLFRYADKCIVLEPEVVAERIREWVWKMLDNYSPPR